MRCEHCGKPLEKGEKFCPECGLPVDFREDWGQDWVLKEEPPKERGRNGKKQQENSGRRHRGSGSGPGPAPAESFCDPPVIQRGTRGCGLRIPRRRRQKPLPGKSPPMIWRGPWICLALSTFLRILIPSPILSVWEAGLPVRRTPIRLPRQFSGTRSGEIRRALAAQQILLMCFSLKADEEYIEFGEMAGGAEAFGEELEKVCDLDQLDTFRILRMDPYTPLEYWGDRGEQDPYSELAAISGADDWEEYLVLYEYDGQTYQGGMTFLCYEDRWYIQYLYRERATPFLQKMSESEYLATPGLE